MFIWGNCAIYIDKNLKAYENSTGIFVLSTLHIPTLKIPDINNIKVSNSLERCLQRAGQFDRWDQQVEEQPA